MAIQSPLSDYLTNPSNSLYLHPNENPSMALVAPPLNGRNYHTWLRAMKMALLSKNKLCFFNGDFPVPDADDPLFPAWERCNTMVLSWIHRSIDESISRLILWIEHAYDVWHDLSERFSQSDVFRIANLQEEICRLQQGSRNVGEYFTEMKTLWDELDNLNPLPKCYCGTLDETRRSREHDQVIRFLKGLNDQFSQVRSHIMLIDPLPNMNKAFSLVNQQERQFNSEIHVDTGMESKAYPVEHQRRTENFNKVKGPRPRGTKLCTHCGRTNHTVDTFYIKHGYPPGFKSRFKGASVNVVLNDGEGE
ncbi:uncharacterized protein LOC133293712 [Gastrolobium bilobum]|uniref:uncharacterized protein LOC133293712 n=1 Tax=Gastrolobium bilobum TaxID=150636 RepID=UPI002AAF6F03|nr:uncharacterized protein LOC133293712 [Gastrolobium bilobum]